MSTERRNQVQKTNVLLTNMMLIFGSVGFLIWLVLQGVSLDPESRALPFLSSLGFFTSEAFLALAFYKRNRLLMVCSWVLIFLWISFEVL